MDEKIKQLVARTVTTHYIQVEDTNEWVIVTVDSMEDKPKLRGKEASKKWLASKLDELL